VRRAGNGSQSVAGIEWNWMRALAADAIPCTTPVAFGEQFHRGREARSAVIMEAVPGASLEKWAASLTSSRGGLEREGGLPPSPLARGVGDEGSGARNDHPIESVLHELVHLVARFHARGYVHRDLYLAHIFYDSSPEKGACLRLIDLQRVFRPKLWLSRWIVKDLAALNYSTPPDVLCRAGRLRWLRKYLQVFGQHSDSRGDGIRNTAYLKRLAIRIAGKTSEIARHDQKRNARIAGASP
jgi:hypothetical protein